MTAQSPAVAPGDEFVAPYAGPGQAGPMILEPSGGLVWFKPLPPNTSATDLQVQQYEGKPVLTWWQGDVTVHGFGLGEDVIADDTYTDIAHVRAGNGHAGGPARVPADPAGHRPDHRLRPDPVQPLVGRRPELRRRSTDSVFQEIDVGRAS